ncbi:hypothetical protein GTH52_05395 [Clostridium tyrobutyricum]|jgi:hypothetical protein|uniref:HNH nuclease domain-containing protein n=1 Tax=Clostridium tyrobutyricum DIVETGP TaxID=1408889 RepID=W6N897_CLOTY|nr:hypothetical protein [Clostridium tyrobutyricum]ANP69290.1 hypothetical protein BA182_06265 [Clostridium tyrobutyricum]MBV4417324.1 hypothetical protein [Clostridium tyrobutyricum]MBV4421250.1 hypothetical protein [Clostridium tyrobutyricum]MBV4425953.1 hypothetical protein [Clostridium tyrobutyricum]MBV4435302.1 hypothetical protein [Clostridium tyrobutyricum]
MENKYEINGDVTLVSLARKHGSEFTTKIDTEDIEKVKSAGTWFAEWHKDFNNYIVQNISPTNNTAKKSKPLKQNLQSLILNTNPKAPIRHINGNTLDNRKCNLEIVKRNTKNDYEVVNKNTIAVLLRDKYGRVVSKALISKQDLDKVINDKYSWIKYKVNDNICVIANTPNGRIQLDKVIMNSNDNTIIHHINLNPLDNRRNNLEISK